MSYTDLIPKAEMGSYEIITDWLQYYKREKKKFETKSGSLPFKLWTMEVKNAIFPNDVLFIERFECKIEFVNVYFKKDLLFFDTQIDEKLFIKQSFCDGVFRIFKTAVFNEDFNIADFSVKSQVFVEGGNFQTCKWSFSDNATVKINGGDYKQLNLGFWGGNKLKELSFHFPEIKGLIKVTGEKTFIERLLLFQFSSEISLAIEDISVNCISIYRFRNEKAFRIFNIKSKNGEKPTEFAIAESFLGKAEFYAIDFTTFENVYFKDVHFIDCSFVDIKWKYDIESFKGRGIGKSRKEENLPLKIAMLRNELKENYDEIESLKNDPDVIEYFSKQREIYRQLKYANEKQGDIINSQIFHSKEMMAYNRTITFEKHPWTKAIIKMSYWFSDFGQSFIKPLIWLILGHWVLLQILIACGHFSGLTINLGNPNWNGFKEAFIQYFKLINPLRRAENTFEGYQIVIDLAMRIWSSYMLYNIIRATRRFIK